ncbi:YraN family protein [Teredinibacter purpureus]|uniref:YraN family protein n=1 Tax=Teredinibacter purpureus TaxID=2731756 RepID=UPI0005F7DE03|nr:YraN family protein [Teredinibacter purpureus]
MLFKRSSKKRAPATITGDAAEDAALAYLKAEGLTLVCRNYHCKMGEIDLIMQQGNTLVIIEVRFRKSNQFGSAIETVTRGKQQKIIKATQHYLLEHRLSDTMPIRFDVIGLDDKNTQWIQAAF